MFANLTVQHSAIEAKVVETLEGVIVRWPGYNDPAQQRLAPHGGPVHGRAPCGCGLGPGRL